MTPSAYKRFSRVFRRNYPSIVATMALVVALVGVPGVTAGGLLITSKQIKNNSITSADIKKSGVKTSDIGTGAVRSADIQTGAVEGSDIGNGEVQPQDVTMPDPQQLVDSATATAKVGSEFALVANVGSYSKADPAAVLEVDWTGTANAPGSSCIFQLRVDGQPAPQGAGMVYVTNVGPESTTSVAVSALFPGLPPGVHAIELWARINNNPGISDPCIVGPSQAGIPQTFVVTEQIV
jgi:hypothetical protein